MYKLFIIIDLSNNNSFEYHKNTLLDFAIELGTVNLLDVSKVLGKKSSINNSDISPKFNIHQPKNYSELKKIFSSQDIILMYGITDAIKYFLINYYLVKYNVKKFTISNLGYNPENYNYFKKNFLEKIKIFLIIRVKYYFFRLLVLLNILPKIDYFFESSSFIINSIEKGLSNKLKQYIPKLDLSYYKKIIKINSKHFDNIFYARYKVSENYIVFIDGMLFDHKDRIMREGIPSEQLRVKYYNNLYKILKNFEKMFNKEIIVCLHPKYNISQSRGDFKDLKCIKFETEKYISEAYLVVFHEGSSIVQAVVQKKKIINLYGEILGDYINKRCNMYANLLKLNRIDLNNIIFEDRENLLNKLNKSINEYEKYISDNIVNDPNKSGISQIIEFLNLKS